MLDPSAKSYLASDYELTKNPHASQSRPCITGTIGAGKTAVLHRAGEVLGEADIGAFAAHDIDAATAKHPRPSDDPFNKRLAIANLACTCENFEPTEA